MFLLIVSHYDSVAQIDIMDGPKKQEKPLPQILHYDSLMNFDNRIDERTYVGQKVYCVGYYYTPLVMDKSKDPKEYNLKGKYLTIVRNPDSSSYNKILLMDDDSNLYRFGGCGKYCAYEGRNSTFVLLGYLEKAKELYKGRDFIYVNEEEKNYYNGAPFNGIFDRATHERRYDIKKGSKWHCDGVGVSLDDKFSVARASTLCNRVVLYLSNNKQDSIYCYLLSSDMESGILYGNGKKSKYILNKFMTPQAYNKLQKEKEAAERAKKEAAEKAAVERRQRLVSAYGEEKANMILRGEIAIGFTKTMCKEAWGDPKYINTTETARVVHEQCVYGNDRYLYFDNGILTTIQR